MESLLVVTNSDAGTSDDERLDRALASLFDQVSVEVTATTNPGELDGVLHRAGSRRIVVAGGDGSLHAVVSALYRRHELERAVLGIIPLGTGNDFARAMEIPLDIDEAVQVLVDGEVRPVDLVVDELGEVVVNAVHIGVGAQASRRGARWKRRLGSVGVRGVNLGRLGYPIGALLAAVKPPYLRLRIEVDGRVLVDLDEPVLMLSIGNGQTVGGGAQLTPDADPEDGKVDVMVSRAIGPIARFSYGAAVALGRHRERDDVLYVRGSRVTVTGGPFWCSADGEIYGPERHRCWHVEPAAYRMVLPKR